jgi:hypothetical protein
MMTTGTGPDKASSSALRANDRFLRIRSMEDEWTAVHL